MVGAEVLGRYRLGQPHGARPRHDAPGGPVARRRDRLPEPGVRPRRSPDRPRLRRAPLHGGLLRRLQGDLPGRGRHRVDHAVPRREDDRRPEEHLGLPRGQPDAGDHPTQRLAPAARLLRERDAQPEARDHPLLLRRSPRGPRGGLRVLEGDGDGGLRAALPDRRDDELGVPAGPEPLPDGQGHVGRGPDRRARGASSRPRRGATTASPSTATSRSCSSTTPRRARCSTRSRPRASPSTTSGKRNCSRSSGSRRGWGSAASCPRTRSAARTSSRSKTSAWPWPRSLPGSGRTRRWPSCRKARRRSVRALRGPGHCPAAARWRRRR